VCYFSSLEWSLLDNALRAATAAAVFCVSCVACAHGFLQPREELVPPARPPLLLLLHPVEVFVFFMYSLQDSSPVCWPYFGHRNGFSKKIRIRIRIRADQGQQTGLKRDQTKVLQHTARALLLKTTQRRALRAAMQPSV
jgi:hypothetical protein